MTYDLEIDVSKEATVVVQGHPFNAFQRNSYSARVRFPDGFVAAIALPEGACENGFEFYYDRVVFNAAAMHREGIDSGFMLIEPPVAIPSIAEYRRTATKTR